MTLHLPPPAGLSGSDDFSISPIIISKAFATLVLLRALVSIQPQLRSRARLCPCSAGIFRLASGTSLLLPTMTMGTDSAPCGEVRGNGVSFGGI